MIPIDMTAHLAPLIIGTELVLLVAAGAVIARAWRSRARQILDTRRDTNFVPNVAIAGNSPSASAMADPVPSDSSVAEAA